MRRAALKLSGRIFDEPSLVHRYAEIIRRRHDVKFAVVTGGGGLARRYIEVARDGGASHTYQDLLGIWSSRLNALLLVSLLEDVAYPGVPSTMEEFLKAWSVSRVVVLGGLQPGQSTATVAALVAEAVRSPVLLNAANVDAVYSEDPRSNPNAVRYRELSYDELEALLKSRPLPGGYELLDVWSISILRRSGIRTYIFDGRDPRRLEAALDGENPGTLVFNPAVGRPS